jgi:hypothetical protein
MSKLPNKRLSKEDREILRTFAGKHINCPAEKAALDAIYKTAKKVVLEVVRQKYPVKDMAVLNKYNQAAPDKCIMFGASRYDRDAIFFFVDDDAPLVPGRDGCQERHYPWTAEQKAVLAEYQLKRLALERAKKDKLDTYTRLIFGSNTFNDITTIWPAAEELRPRIVPQNSFQRGLSVLSESAIAMIKADNAGAQVPA